MLSSNLPIDPKHWGSLLKNVAFPEGNDLFPGNSHAPLEEINAGIP